MTFLRSLPAKIARAKKAVAALVAALPGLVAIVTGFDPELAAAITAVLVALGVYVAPANKA